MSILKSDNYEQKGMEQLIQSQIQSFRYKIYIILRK